MKPHLVFVHGWGMTPGFWDELIAELPDFSFSVLNLGFVVNSRAGDLPCDGVYVTHSLGTMWALHHYRKHMKAFVAINGFSYFLDFVDERALKTMKKRLNKYPEKQMQEFWRACGLRAWGRKFYIPALQSGLDCLIGVDLRPELASLNCPKLSLISDEDPLLSLPKLEKQWDGTPMRLCEGGGHALPQTHPEWCAKKIGDFVDGV